MNNSSNAHVIDLMTHPAQRNVFERFLAEQRAISLASQKKTQAEVPLNIVYDTFAPYFKLAETGMFPLCDTSESVDMAIRVSDALSCPYEGKPPRVDIRSLSDRSGWNRVFDCPSSADLLPLADTATEYFGNSLLQDQIIRQLAPLSEIIRPAISTHLPVLNAEDTKAISNVGYLFDAIHGTTMAILFATAWTAIVDDHDGYVLFANLAKIQQNAFLAEVDANAYQKTIYVYLK